MNNCGHEDKDFSFGVSPEEFEKVMQEPAQIIQDIKDKLKIDMQRIKDMLQEFQASMKKQIEEGKEPCQHEIATKLEPIIDEAMKTLFLTGLYNEFAPAVVDANEIVANMLDGLAALSADEKGAKKAVNLIRIKKKQNWFF